MPEFEMDIETGKTPEKGEKEREDEISEIVPEVTPGLQEIVPSENEEKSSEIDIGIIEDSISEIEEEEREDREREDKINKINQQQ